MASQARRAKEGREVEDEETLEFIAGFPCTQFSCHGTLLKGRHHGRTAITCSVCEHVYYVLIPA